MLAITISRWLRDRWLAKPLEGKALTLWASMVYERVYGVGDLDHWREEDDPNYVPSLKSGLNKWEVAP